MTAVAIDTSLDWVTFSDEEQAKPCARKPPTDPCPLEAVFRIFFEIRCTHPERDMDVCLPHKDEVVAKLNDPEGQVVCLRCGARITLLRVEPIR